MKKKIVLTGGHAGTTALAVIQELLKKHNPKELLWIGPKYAFEGSDKLTLEFKVFPEKGVDCSPIVAGRLQRKFTRYTFTSLLKIPIGFVQALGILLKAKPHVVLSFGGFASFPVIVISYLLGIPVVVHEQTTGFGLANRLSAFFARKIAIARQESVQFIKSEKVLHLGNPLLEEIRSLPLKEKLHKPVTIYITGGSRGSQIINRSVDIILEKLLERYNLIHQTGDYDYKHFASRKDALPRELQTRYQVFNFVSPLEIQTIYKKTDILVGRSGANTVSETLAIRLPSIFIPIPWSQLDEQTKNAQLAVSSNNAILLKQNELNGEKLYSEIEYVIKNYPKFTKNTNNVAELDRKAAHALAQLLDTFIS